MRNENEAENPLATTAALENAQPACEGEAGVRRSTLPSEAVTKCLIDEVEQLQFPKPRGGVEVEVNYPWVFTSAP